MQGLIILVSSHSVVCFLNFFVFEIIRASWKCLPVVKPWKISHPVATFSSFDAEPTDQPHMVGCNARMGEFSGQLVVSSGACGKLRFKSRVNCSNLINPLRLLHPICFCADIASPAWSVLSKKRHCMVVLMLVDIKVSELTSISCLRNLWAKLARIW